MSSVRMNAPAIGADRAAAAAEEADAAEDDRRDRGEDEDVAGRLRRRQSSSRRERARRPPRTCRRGHRRRSSTRAHAERRGRARRPRRCRSRRCRTPRRVRRKTSQSPTIASHEDEAPGASTGSRGASCSRSGSTPPGSGQDLDREPLVDRERRERDEDRLQPPVRDEHAVHAPPARPEQEHEQRPAEHAAGPACMCVAASAFVRRRSSRRRRGRSRA